MVLLPSGAKPNPDDFSTVMRFESKKHIQCFSISQGFYIYSVFLYFLVILLLFPVEFSGSWGYGSPSNPTYECIRFNASQEVLLGGIGLFAGRGEYKADIIVSDTFCKT